VACAQNTGHIDNDEVFYPQRVHEFRETVKKAPLFLGLGWFYYLVRGQVRE
jgi:hypothetical protein